MRKHKKLLPICCSNLGGGTKTIIKDETPLIEAASLMCSTKIPSIGSVINDGTAMYSILSQLEEGSEEYIEVSNRLKHMVRISQSVIDASKNGKFYITPNEWTKGDDNLSTQKRKPEFQMDKYTSKKADLNKLKDKCNFLSIANFGVSFAELQQLNESDLTANQKELIELYNANCKVFILDNNSMNQIHSQVNKVLKIKTHSKNAKGTKELLKCGDVDYTTEMRTKLQHLLVEYTNDIRSYTTSAINLLTDRDERVLAIKDYTLLRRQEVEEAIELMGDLSVITNAFVDIVYASNRFSDIMWSVCGDQIIKNLLDKNDNKMKVIVQDDKGSIDYLGVKYSVIAK